MRTWNRTQHNNTLCNNKDGGSGGNKGKHLNSSSWSFITRWGPQNSQKPFYISFHEHPFGQSHEESHWKRARLLRRSWSLHQARSTRWLASHHPIQRRKRILRCVSCPFFRDRISGPSSSLRLHHSWLVYIYHFLSHSSSKQQPRTNTLVSNRCKTDSSCINRHFTKLHTPVLMQDLGNHVSLCGFYMATIHAVATGSASRIRIRGAP